MRALLSLQRLYVKSMMMPDLQATHSEYGFSGHGMKLCNILVNNENQRKTIRIPYFFITIKAANPMSMSVR